MIDHRWLPPREALALGRRAPVASPPTPAGARSTGKVPRRTVREER